MKDLLIKFEKYLIEKNEQCLSIVIDTRFFDFRTKRFFKKKVFNAILISLNLSFIVVFLLFFTSRNFSFGIKVHLLDFFSGWAIVSISTLFSVFKNETEAFFYYNIINLPFGNKEQRIKEIFYFLENNFDLKNKIEVKSLNLVKEFKDSPKEFISKNFNSNQSFIRFYLEKSYDEGIVNVDFITSSLFVPKRNEINGESLKKILISIYSSNLKTKIFCLQTMDAWNDLFKKYTEKEIETLFCKKFKKDDFLYCLENVDKLVFEKKFDSFSNMVKEIKKRKIPKYLLNFNFKIESLDYKFLLTQSEYDECSELFSNCIKSYYNKINSNIICYFKDNNPIACIEIDDFGKILELKGYKNGVVPKETKTQIECLMKCIKP